MLGLPPSVRIYFAIELADMRKGIDGLRAIVEGELRHDPYAGHLFVFVGKARDEVKILFWDRSGFVLYLKRLEKGRFQLPVVDARRQHVIMDPAQLAMLLDGIDLNARRLGRWTPNKDQDGRKGIDTEGQAWSKLVDDPPARRPRVLAPEDRRRSGGPAREARTRERAAEEDALRCEERALGQDASGEGCRPATPEEVKKKRRERAAEAKAQTPTLRVEHKVPDELRRCTACGRTDLVAIGQGKTTSSSRRESTALAFSLVSSLPSAPTVSRSIGSRRSLRGRACLWRALR